MEIDGAEEEEPVERPIFSIRLLQLVQTAQSQHGIRHNDYDRYRCECGLFLARPLFLKQNGARTRSTRPVCTLLRSNTPPPALIRKYCGRRLRRLHVKTRFLHGKGRYQKKKLEPAMATEERCVGQLAAA